MHSSGKSIAGDLNLWPNARLSLLKFLSYISLDIKVSALDDTNNYENHILKIFTEIQLIGLILILNISCTTNGYRAPGNIPKG